MTDMSNLLVKRATTNSTIVRAVVMYDRSCYNVKMESEKNKNPEIRASPTGRKPRADGVESRRIILDAAARLATTRGLEGLSIGELAQQIGMSKSGLYAHFKSKEEL